MRKNRIVVLVVPPIEELDLVGPEQSPSPATRLMRSHDTQYPNEVLPTSPYRIIAGESGLSNIAQSYYKELEGDVCSPLVGSGVKTRNRRDDELSAWLRAPAPKC